MYLNFILISVKKNGYFTQLCFTLLICLHNITSILVTNNDSVQTTQFGYNRFTINVGNNSTNLHMLEEYHLPVCSAVWLL
jgi:hypothetical protein